MTHIPCMMEQQPDPQASNHTGNPDFTHTMDLMGVMPQHIQQPWHTLYHQAPPHLLPSTTSSSCPLPNIPISTQIDLHICSFSSQNNENCPLYDTQAFPFSSTYVNLPTNNNSTNTQPHNIPQNNLLSPTPLLSPRYPFFSTLPTIKELSTPSSPTYIPILTGRLDWCPWSEALMMAIMGMNLFSHITENYNAQWGFDPGSIPTYPPTINPNSSHEEFHAWNQWWIRDGQVLHLLISQLSPSACAQLPGAGSSQPQWRTAHSVYKELVHLFGITDFHTAAVTWDELIALHCTPSRVADYVARWWSGLNKLTSSRHLFDHADSLWHFVNHLPFGSAYDIICEFVLFGLSTACSPDQLPSFESVVECVINIDLNHAYFQPPCSCHPNNEPNTTTMPTPKDNLATLSGAATTTNPSTQPRSSHTSNFCMKCCCTGNTGDNCPTDGGGQGGGITDQNKTSVHAYMMRQEMAGMMRGKWWGGVDSPSFIPTTSPELCECKWVGSPHITHFHLPPLILHPERASTCTPQAQLWTKPPPCPSPRWGMWVTKRTG